MRKTRLLNEQKKAKIRALEGTMTITQIAKKLHHSWLTVRQVLDEGKAPALPRLEPEDDVCTLAIAGEMRERPTKGKRKPLTETERTHICEMAETMSFSGIREVTGRSWEFIKKIVTEGKTLPRAKAEDLPIKLANKALEKSNSVSGTVQDLLTMFRNEILTLCPDAMSVYMDLGNGCVDIQSVASVEYKIDAKE